MSKLQSPLARRLSIFIFAVGYLLTMSLAGIAIWGDLEAAVAMSDPSLAGKERLRSLRCPILITAEEAATVSASFTNPADRTLRLIVQTQISRGYITLRRDEQEILTLAPGETQSLAWAVTTDDVVFGRLILVRVHSLRNNPMPERRGACGIMVVNVPYLNGRQLVVLLLVTGLLGQAGGMALWSINNQPLAGRPRSVMYSLVFLTGLAGAALLAGFSGIWLLGVLIFALILLALGAMFEQYVRH